MTIAAYGFSLGTSLPAHISGRGLIAGDPPMGGDPDEPDEPDGRAKILNVPSRVRVSVFERSTMICIASVLSAEDGTWRVTHLKPTVPFVVIGFDGRGLVNAAIQDWIYPAAME